MANPQTWTDPNTGDVYELIPDAPEAQAPKTWTDPKTGDTYELIPDNETAAPTPKARTLEAPAEQTVASLAFKNNPQAAAAAQSLWDAGVRNPEAFNTALRSKFPQFSGKIVTFADIAAARKRDAFYKARGQKNPGNFLFTESTGVADPEAPTDVFSAAIQGGKKSLENMANSATGLAALAAETVGAEETGDYLLNKYIEDQAKIDFNNPAAVKSVQDIGGIGDASMYAAETLGALVPQITSSMGVGALGANLGGRVGAAAGVMANTSAQETGSIYGDTYRETGVKAPVSSVLAGLAAGGLDAITPFRALGRLGVPAEVITEKLASRIVKTGAKGMLVEGGTEAAQTFIEGLPESVVTGKSPFTEEMLDRMVDAFTRGAIGGGAVGAGTEALRPNASQPVAEEIPEAAPEITPEAPAPIESDEPLPFEAPDFLQTPAKSPFKKTPDFLNQSAKPKGRAKPVETTVPANEAAAPLVVNKQQAADHINDVLAADWKNAPPITTVERLEELPADVRQSVIDDGAQDAKGITVNGQVYILAHNLKDLDDLAGVTYHEALGHAGLGMQFGKRLNAVLEQIYNTNQMVREAADAWLAKNSTQSESPTAHAVEEILAETSEGGKVEAKVIEKIKAFLKQYARRVPGLKNLKYTDKEVFAILSMANNKVISGNSKATSGNGNRYIGAANDNSVGLTRLQEIINEEAEFSNIQNVAKALTESDFRADIKMRLAQEGLPLSLLDNYKAENKYSKPDNSNRPRGLRPDKIVGKKKSFYEPFLKQLEEEGAPRVVQTWEETEELAKDIGMNVDKVMKLDRGPKAEEYTAGVNFMMGRLNLIGDLSEKVANGKATDRDKDKLAIYLRQFADMFDVLSETKTTIARTLNIMNRIVDNQKAAANNLRYMLSAESQSLLDDPNKVKQLADKINELKGNPAAQAKAVKMMADPRFEDYIQDIWFNSVLSNPITHKINVLGSVGNFLTDLAESGFASVIGQTRRGDPKADRVLAREVLWRFYGAVMGLKGAFGKAGQAFMAGEPVTKIGALERSHNLIKGRFASMLEGPSKALAAEDEFMRNIIMTSSYYGMAIRTAASEGRKGQNLFTRAHQLVVNPTDEMILTAADYTRALQFVDKPSKPARTYLTLMSRNDKDGYTARGAKFLGSLFTPFIPTADSIFRSAIRRSPLGGLDRYNQTDFKAGGARADVAKARIIMGSMLAMWVASEVLKGNISGNGPDDYRRRAELEAGGWRANSIKMGDQWVPFDGLDPLAMNLSMVANAVEDYKESKADQKGYTDQAIAAVGGVVRALGTSSWLKSLAFITEGINDARTGQQAVENLTLNTATGMIPYSGMGRFMGSMRDPVERDVSSDGTMAGRFEDRVKSVVPFLKSSLPARHDVYGRERAVEDREGLGWLGRHPQTTIDNNPVVVELQRLANVTGKTLIPPVGKDDGKRYGIERLNSEQYQQYQDYAGDLILAASKEAIETPDWEALTDEEKVEEIKAIAKDMRAMAREDLFGPLEEEGQEEDATND